MAETTFLQEGDVTVTSARIVVGSKTYPLNGITSIRHEKKTPGLALPITLMAIGAIIAMQPDGAFFGIPVFAVGIAFLFLRKPAHSIVLSSAGRDVEALSSKDKGLIEKIVVAANDAIVHRG